MEQDIKILKFLIENNSEKFTIKEISKNLETDYKNTYQNIEKLSKEGTIIKKKIANITQIEFNHKINSKVFKVEWIKREELFEKKDFRLIYNRIKDLNNPFIIVLLFGSYAKKTNFKHSDIDVCLIANDKNSGKALYEKLSLLPLNVQLHEFTTKEFKSMLKTKENNLGDEIKKNNIIIYGIENYYNLINDE